MNGIRRLIVFAVAACLGGSDPASAQGTLDDETLKLYGGTYMSDCGNPASPKVTVFGDALVFLNGSKRVTGSNVQASYSYYGRVPPTNFQTALVSEVPGGMQMLFVVYHDDSGDYIMLDGDPKVMAQIGNAIVMRKFRRCEGAAKRMTAAPSPARSSTSEAPDAAGMLSNSKFKSAYYRALGPRVRERWLAKLDGPSPQTKKVMVAGKEYILVSSCKDQDCADNNTVLLYSSARGVVYGKVYQKGTATLIGRPPAAVARELERLWRSEWREGQ